jgi:hypothetical protein
VGIIERLAVTQLLEGRKAPECLANDNVRLFLYGMFADKDREIWLQAAFAAASQPLSKRLFRFRIIFPRPDWW